MLALLLLIGAGLLALSTAQASGAAQGNPAGSGGAPRSPQALNPPTNIACLPFPQGTITEYNGETVEGPFTSDADQTFITWRDESGGEDNYHVYRRIGNGDWVEIAELAANSTNYTDTGLEEHDDYYYRVRASEGNSFSGYSDTCRKPAFLDSDGGNFRVFYRPHFPNCPDIEDLDGGVEPMCSSEDTAQRIAAALEASRDALLALDFEEPVLDPPLAVDLSLCDGAGCARSIDDTTYLSLRPSSMETPFNPATGDGQSSLKVPWHELVHKIQRGLTDPHGKWVSEGQARASEDKFCLDPNTCDLSVDNLADTVYLDQLNLYLSDPNVNLLGDEYGTSHDQYGYRAVLFWTYITEQYGALTDEPERGMDFMAQFWQSAEEIEHTHGIEVVNHALGELGHSEDFHDVFKDFVVANYAKDIPNAPAHYQYIDESQAPGAYDEVARTVDMTLGVGNQFIADAEDLGVEPWGVHYYRFEPDVSVPTLDIQSETLTGNELYYHLLAVKNGSIVEEINQTGSSFSEAIPNDDFDEVVLVVAGLDEGSNFSLAVNATEPELRILDPVTSHKAQAGDPFAPEKIIIKLEVLSPEGGGTPISGIDPASFDITIGGVAVPPNQLISSTYVQGQYWLNVRAPMQAGTGTYTLLVENDTVADGVTLSDSQAASVQYGGAAIESDNLIVGDRSGSMDDVEGKLESAQDAARLYVDSWEEGDQLGVISYNDEAVVDPGLQPWDDDSRDAAFEVINDWVADGGTAIGNALLVGLDEFDAEGDPAQDYWNILLLSDGMENEGVEPNLQDFIAEYNARKDASEPVPTVYPVALGADADQDAMQQLACDTGDCGNYHFAGESAGGLHGPLGEAFPNNELAEIYRIVAENIALEQQIYSARDFLPVGLDVHTHRIRVDGSASEAVFAVNWVQTGNPTPVDVQLRRPDGVLVTERLGDPNHYLYRIPLPMQGEWTITIAYDPPGLAPEATGEGGFDYLVEAALRSDLTMELFLGLAPEERLTGTPMPILVSLSDVQALTGATVVAEIANPFGTLYYVALHDDGQHGDGAGGDGFYGGTFYQTYVPGSYNLVVDAAGVSPLHGQYTRRVRTAFY
ncbi:MAG: choice-of-anchor X domain-containing protein, partial [Ardenticatenaceae bacterium]